MTAPAAGNLFGEDVPAAPPLAAGCGDCAGYAHVALEQGIDVAPAGLTYAVPTALADLVVGERVIVPLGRGNRPVAGYVIERRDTSDLAGRHAAKAILRRDEGQLHLPGDLVELARWIAGYYVCPIGMVLSAMLPAAVKRGTGSVIQTLVGLPPDDATHKAASSARGLPKLSKLQQAVRDAAELRLAEGHAWTPIKQLADLAGARSVSPVKQLIDKGQLVTRREQTVVSDLDLRAQQVAEAVTRVTLNAGQTDAIAHLIRHLDEGFGVHLLHGVTGSGKTEVYLRLIEHAIMADGGWRMVDGNTISDDGASTDLDAEGASQPASTETPSASDPSPIPHPPSAIVLVPEIALTPQTVARFVARFGHVAVLHSGLTAAQRHAQWRRIHAGEASIVVGARSAVFAPLPNLKLIIVDEEHEPSYKQDQLPRYHGRDVAIKRAQLRGIPVVLGSATPSLESYSRAIANQNPLPPGGRGQGEGAGAEKRCSEGRSHGDAGPLTQPSPPEGERASDGARWPADAPRTHQAERLKPLALQRAKHYHLIHMPDRAPGMKLPTVELVDLQKERTQRRGIHLLSLRLETELGKLLSDTAQPRGQAMLLLNRRGYANYIACPDHRCGWMMRCDYCDVTMVYHKDQRLPTGGLVRCHHCDAEQMLAQHCPTCSKKISVFGLGTQRVEEEIARKFPQARLLRMDRDTMRTARDYQESLDRFRRGEIDVLLGTQMIAKGLDFPNVRLVGVISADTALNMPDFRAAERTFQLIAQVSGRAGRSSQLGLVIVQSFNVDDPAILSAAQHDYEGFAARELATRAEAGLPPITRMARLVVRDADHVACAARAQELAQHLEQANRELKLDVRLRGPMPCPIARIAGFHRQQIELIASQASRIQKLLTTLRNRRLLVSDMHTAVDVDPIALL